LLTSIFEGETPDHCSAWHQGKTPHGAASDQLQIGDAALRCTSSSEVH